MNVVANMTGLEIAIIGMSCRFPGAKNIDEFWQNLKNGVSSISHYSDEELFESGVASELIENPDYVKASGYLPDIEMFDALFFNFTPKDAKTTDPQRRLFLECAWEAMENAGYRAGDEDKLTGVYAGAGMNFYILKNLSADQNFLTPANIYQVMLNNEKDFLPLQVCYKLNLKGPGINIQTACSTSLVAVHCACQALLNQEIDMALAGGVSLYILKKFGYLYQNGMILSPDGHCRAFDAKAEGTVPGRGCGIVVLKRLEEAMDDNDTIYAVIKGSAINNDGSVKVGYTAPGVEGQAAAISEAQAVAQVDPETISYIEAHGTGTQLGDPIELRALTQAFGEKTSKKQFCAIGSVKTNIGHTDAAAGVAGLIKTALALKNETIPPSLDFTKPNPEIDFANSPFYVNDKLAKWERKENFPRRAGVSAFGIGGTNAHVVLEEAPQPDISKSRRKWHLITLSAKTDTALNTAALNLAGYLKENKDVSLADVAYTLQAGRTPFSHRMFLVCKNTDEAVAKLELKKDINKAFYEEGEKPPSKEDSGPYPDTQKGLTTIGNSWLKGAEIDISKIYENEKRARISLPTYPFERERYWIEPRKAETEPETNDYSMADSIEENIAGIWKKYIGDETICFDDNFFDVGGDSLLAVRIVSEIKRLFSVEISVNDFLSVPTISEMADSIKSKKSVGDQTSSLLVKIQKGDQKKRPLFLIHPVGGNVLFYRELAYGLGDKRPVYGIRARGAEKGEEPIRQVFEMAEEYIEEIRSVQPEGPYLLGGSSFGGMVAFEIARRLLTKKEKTGLLVMIDTPGPGHMPIELEDEADCISYMLEVGAGISVSSDKLRKLGSDEMLKYFAEQMSVANKALLPAELTTEELRRFFRIFALNVQAMRNYSPEVYSGKIIYFRAKERDEFIPHHPENAWLYMATEGIEVHEVPGNHITMNESPHVKVIAEHLNKYIGEAL